MTTKTQKGCKSTTRKNKWTADTKRDARLLQMHRKRHKTDYEEKQNNFKETHKVENDYEDTKKPQNDYKEM